MPHALPPLPYDFDALEPYLDGQTLRIHHGKHHATYVEKLNAALEKFPDLHAKPIEELLRDVGSLPEAIRTAVRNHGGGHSNHGIFWQNMKANGGGDPRGELAAAVTKTFGTLQGFRDEFTKTAVGVFGSGWAWLVADGDGVKLVARPNQESPLMDGLTPLLGLDVWEHAYYLKYQNRRADYVKAFWNVVNWDDVAQRHAASVSLGVSRW